MNATTETLTDSQDAKAFSWALSPAEYALTVAKIAKINARATKKGFTGRIDVIAERREITGRDETGFTVTRIVYDTRITGDAPSYDGWTFIATLDWDEHAGLVVRTAPGVESVTRDGLVEGHCDHCKVKRYRKATFLVRNVETGEERQIGRQCIKDFLGWKATPAFISEDGVRGEIEAWGFGGGAREDAYTVDTILGVAWAATMAFGFVPASSWDRTPTAEVVRTVLAPVLHTQRDRDDHRDLLDRLAEYATDAVVKAADVREFVASDDFNGGSEYVTNLKAIAGAEYASFRNIGVLASAPQAWARHQERTLVRKVESGPESVHFGQVKERLTFTGVVEAIRWIDGDYGVTTLYTLRAEDGRVAKWFASRDALGQIEGVTVTVKATVKGHGEYNGRKETTLTRCAVVEPVEG
jgi:hypothetical protein